VEGSLNIGRFAGVQVSFDTYLLQILQRGRVVRWAKRKARDDPS
jgi:hypothetical protein